MKYCCFILVFIFSKEIRAQNLLVNGSFEDENICTEYQVNCAPEGWISSSDGFNNYFKDENRAHTGSHCMTFLAGHSIKPHFRTFLRSQLICSLRKGSPYRLELYFKSPHAILDSIGFQFTGNDPLLVSPVLHIGMPSLWGHQGNELFSKDSSWQKIEIVFQGTGEEIFLTIGNFSRRNITGPTGIQKENNFFVYVDDISLVPLQSSEGICADWKQAAQILYDQDDRHQFLRRSLLAQKNNPRRPVLGLITQSRIDTLVLPDVLFRVGKKDLLRSGYNVLDSLCRYISANKVDSIVIDGHTDNTGTSDINEQLSLDRAMVAGAYFEKCGMHGKNRIITRGWGASRPVADNNDTRGRALNRRVEIRCYLSQ